MWHVCLLAGVFLVASASAQDAQAKPGIPPKQEDDYSVISSIPWDVTKSGPVVAVCARSIAKGNTLKELGRKAVPIGALTAIVPVKMIALSSHFTEEPNLYGCLPREAKVLYLLTLLSDDQWRKVTGDGLSLGDCKGQQLAVMQSILPNPFVYTEGTLLSRNSISLGNQDSPDQHSDQERGQVKCSVPGISL